jgi:hypothetical protein
MTSKSRGLTSFLRTFAFLTAAMCPATWADFVTKPNRPDKPRLLVLTDISNEPDDEESLVRLLVYSNEFDIEGLVATTSTYLRDNPREDLIRRGIAAYGEARPNLTKHADGYPTAESLLAVTKTGQNGFGMGAVKREGFTPGSQRIIEAGDRADARPLWISVWGGSNTLAQALTDVRESRSIEESDKFISKLRVYSISDQDDAGAWIRSEFPKLFYIVSPSNPTNSQEYFRSTWNGISGDRLSNIGQMHHFEMVDNPWLEENVMKNHGPLGALYPPLKYLMEGDTPSFFGLIDNGLHWETSPSFGGWGGRYSLFQPAGEPRPIWTDNALNRDTVTAENGRTETSNHATIWRWREHFQNDFAARMDWCVADNFDKANHNPRPVLNGDRSTQIIRLRAKPGEILKLSADGSDAGDAKQQVKLSWWIYQEAGGLSGASLSQTSGTTTEVTLPKTNKSGTVHVILQAEDDGTPKLFAYRRAVIEMGR